MYHLFFYYGNNIMVTSSQITQMVKDSPNPMEKQFKIWTNTRYLVAQQPATPDYSDTKPGYYRGRVVIPGPKYNPKVSEGLELKGLTINDFQILMNRYYIRFIDNRTTDNADDSVKKGLYTVMSNEESDAYEKELAKHHANKRKRISS